MLLLCILGEKGPKSRIKPLPYLRAFCLAAEIRPKHKEVSFRKAHGKHMVRVQAVEQKVQIQPFRGKSSQGGGNGLGLRSKQRERTALWVGKKHDCKSGELRRSVWLESKIYRERSANISKGHIMQGRKRNVCHCFESELQWIRERRC